MTDPALIVPVLTPEDAGAWVQPNSTLTVGGVVGSLVPDVTLKALGRRFAETNAPGGLTVVAPVAVGDVIDCPGLDHLAIPGLIETIISGSFVYGVHPTTGVPLALPELVRSGKLAAFNFPIGVMFAAMREGAANRPGLFTKVGLGTFQDPRQRGGRLNDATPKGFVSVVELDGEEYLRFVLPRPDIAILRGSIADEYGNVSLQNEVIRGGLLVQALATHNAGGKVIIEVEHLVGGGSLPGRAVDIPGVLVDALVVAHGQQATGISFDPYLSGELKAPETWHPTEELVDPTLVILEHVVPYLVPKGLVILGFGIPSKLPLLSGLPAGVRFTIEHGAVGGQPSGGLVFGGAVNAEAILDTPSMFDLIDGGGLDGACLGFAEIGPDGSVNVSNLPTHLPGSGGFTNITAATRRLVFCGTFTAGGLSVDRSKEGVTEIKVEGKHRKFVNTPREKTFVPDVGRGQEVFYVTDRCVLELRGGRLTVISVYPGVDLNRDILGQCDYPLEVAV